MLGKLLGTKTQISSKTNIFNDGLFRLFDLISTTFR